MEEKNSSQGTATRIRIELSAAGMAFDKTNLTVPAGAEVVVNFNNRDAGVPHNFAVYTDSSAKEKIFAGEIITGPARAVYKFNAPRTPGSYFFRCDVHPLAMTGHFVVT